MAKERKNDCAWLAHFSLSLALYSFYNQSLHYCTRLVLICLLLLLLFRIDFFYFNLWHATNHMISLRAHAHPSPQLFRQLLCCYLISGFLFLSPPPLLLFFFYLINYAAEDILIFSSSGDLIYGPHFISSCSFWEKFKNFSLLTGIGWAIGQRAPPADVCKCTYNL